MDVLREAVELGLLNYIEFRQRGLDPSPGMGLMVVHGHMVVHGRWTFKLSFLEGPLGAMLLPLRSIS